MKSLKMLSAALVATIYASIGAMEPNKASYNELYVGKKGDLYFALEHVTDKNKNIEFWRNFVKEQDRKTRRIGVLDEKGQKNIQITDGIDSFFGALRD